MLRITQAQLDAFEHKALERFVQLLGNSLRESFPESFRAMSNEALESYLQVRLAAADMNGFHSEAEVADFVRLTHGFTDHLARDEEQRRLLRIIGRVGGEAQEQRLVRLIEHQAFTSEPEQWP